MMGDFDRARDELAGQAKHAADALAVVFKKMQRNPAVGPMATLVGLQSLMFAAVQGAIRETRDTPFGRELGAGILAALRLCEEELEAAYPGIAREAEQVKRDIEGGI